jgi:hypothetical protein
MTKEEKQFWAQKPAPESALSADPIVRQSQLTEMLRVGVLDYAAYRALGGECGKQS